MHLEGSRTHPQEKEEYKGIWDNWFHDTDRVPRGLDFFSIYQSGYNFSHGMSVYYGVREHRYGNEFLVVPYFSGFRYLPAYAYTYGYVLSMARPWTSYWIWLLCVELLLLFNIFLISKYEAPRYLKILVTGLWLAYSPFYVELHIGQQSMVTVTLLHLMGYFHIIRWTRSRDTGYIFSVLWKLNTLIFLPLWVKFKRFNPLLILFSLVLILSLPYFMVVPGSFAEFSSYFHHKFIALGPNSMGLWAFAGTLVQKLTPHSPWLGNALKIWSLIILSCAGLVTLLPRRINFIYGIALWTSVYFLSYQYVWEHHYVMMLPAVTLLTLHDRSWKWLIPGIFFALPTPYIFLNDPSLPMPQINWSIFELFLYHGIKVIPAAAIFGILAFRMARGKIGEEQNSDQLDLKSLIPFYR